MLVENQKSQVPLIGDLEHLEGLYQMEVINMQSSIRTNNLKDYYYYHTRANEYMTQILNLKTK